jgi:hypothetical protein
MLQYTDMDIYKQEMSNQVTEKKVIGSILYQIKTGNISSDLDKCILKYEDIAHYIDELQKKNRNADPLLEKGIELYKKGLIIIFNGELTSYDQYKLPPYLMFIPYEDKLIFNINGLKKANWKKVGQNEYEYNFSNAFVELKFILVTAQIMYEMLINKKENAVINDQKLMTLVTQTYVDFFKKAIGRAGVAVDEWDIDRLNFAIAKFFYMHSLGFSERETDKIVANMYYFEDYQISDMKLSEEQLDYSSLYNFVPTLTKLFYKKELKTKDLVNQWASSFGFSIFTEIEYFPTLLTHLLVLILGVEFVNQRYDLKSKKDAIYQRLTVILK